MSGVEHRFVGGSWEGPGPATSWIRLRVPILPDVEPSPFQRVVAAADFGNGISSLVDFEALAYINPDLTVYLHRLPVDEWVCLDCASARSSRTASGSPKARCTTGRVASDGRCGALLVEKRD